MADTWGWREIKLFFRFTIYSFTGLGSLVGAWIALGLPQVASQTYVDDKFRPIQSQILSTRIQLNKLTRQNLEAEHYRLTQQNKTDSSYEIQKRLNDIIEQLADTADERKRLLGPPFNN